MSDKKRMSLFFVVAALFNVAASLAHPVTPTLFKSLALGDHMFGVVLACMLTLNFLFSPFWGKLSSYVSSRTVLLICGIGYGIGQALFGMSRVGWHFVLARAFTGIFTGGCFVCLLTYVVNVSPDEATRGRNLVISATLMSVCGAFGFFAGGVLGELGVYVSIGVQVATLCLCGVLFRLVCKDDRPPMVRVDRRQLVRESNPFSAFIQSRQFMTVTLAFLFAMCILQSLSQTIHDQSFNYYAIDQLGLSTGYNGLVKFIMGMATLVANSTLCVWLMNKTDTRKSVIGVFILGAVAMTCVVLLDTLVPFFMANILFFMLCAVTLPMLQNMVAESADKKQSNLVMGFYNAMKSLGAIIGALISGFAYAYYPKLPFICCIAAFAIAAGCGLVYLARSSYRASVQCMEDVQAPDDEQLAKNPTCK